MKAKNILEITGNAVMYALTFIQTKEVFEIISLILSILISIVILITNVIVWFKKANADGKITKEETEELVEIVKDGTEKIKDKADKL